MVLLHKQCFLTPYFVPVLHKAVLKNEPGTPFNTAGAASWMFNMFVPTKMDKKTHPLPSLKLTANAPENGWLENEMSFWGMAYFQVQAVNFREGDSFPP